MNTKVYAITDPDEEDLDAEGVLDFDWDELYLFMSPHGKPNMRSKVLWVVEAGGIAGWFDLIETQTMPEQIVVYNNIENMPNKAKKRFLEACFKEV